MSAANANTARMALYVGECSRFWVHTCEGWFRPSGLLCIEITGRLRTRALLDQYLAALTRHSQQSIFNQSEAERALVTS